MDLFGTSPGEIGTQSSTQTVQIVRMNSHKIEGMEEPICTCVDKIGRTFDPVFLINYDQVPIPNEFWEMQSTAGRNYLVRRKIFLFEWARTKFAKYILGQTTYDGSAILLSGNNLKFYPSGVVQEGDVVLHGNRILAVPINANKAKSLIYDYFLENQDELEAMIGIEIADLNLYLEDITEEKLDYLYSQLPIGYAVDLVAEGMAALSLRRDVFEGAGSEFELSYLPAEDRPVLVYLNGLLEREDFYEISDQVLVFSEVIEVGERVDVMYYSEVV